jgi:hypothetical protein
MPSTISLTLNHRITETAAHAFRLQAWVSETENIVPEVFLVRDAMEMPEITETPIFVRVCSYSDLVNYDTAPDAYRRHYRVRSLDLTYISYKDADTELATLLIAVEALKSEIVTLDGTAEVSTTRTHSVWLQSTRLVKNSANAVSKTVTLTLTDLQGTRDAALLLVAKSSSASDSLLDSNTELVAVASPDDCRYYAATAGYPSLYRASSAHFVFPDTEQMDLFLAAVTTDLDNTAAAYTRSASASTAYSGVITDTNYLMGG